MEIDDGVRPSGKLKSEIVEHRSGALLAAEKLKHLKADRLVREEENRINLETLSEENRKRIDELSANFRKGIFSG